MRTAAEMYKDMWDVVGDEVVGASDIGWLARVPDPAMQMKALRLATIFDVIEFGKSRADPIFV